MLVPVVELAAALADVPAAARLAVCGEVFVSLSPGDARAPPSPAALALLRAARYARAGPFSAADVDAALAWLDGGAAAVLFDVDVGADAAAPAGVAQVAGALSALPPQRAAVRLVGVTAAAAEAGAGGEGGAFSPLALAALAALRPLVNAVVLPFSGAAVPFESVRQLRAHAGPLVSITLERTSCGAAEAGAAALAAPADPATAPSLLQLHVMQAADVGRLHRQELHVMSRAVRDSAATAEDLELECAAGRLDVGCCAAACARSDRPDGLITTVVSDEGGRALGLVFSSRESIIEAVRCGRGVYYSRSRSSLWRKGDTSGNFQELRALRLDCDCDALLFTVRQMGAVPAFCHLNTRSCWGEDGGLASLERTLASRLVDAPPGSYTKRLFEDPALLKNKLMEEAMELAEAEEPDHVAAEAADLLYFVLVRCAKAGVGLADVEAHLDRRALKVRRRPGDSKQFRIDAARAFEVGLAQPKAGPEPVPAGAGAQPS